MPLLSDSPDLIAGPVLTGFSPQGPNTNEDTGSQAG